MAPPAILLVRPREQGNVGAVARAMANMGLERLVLVEPAPEVGGIARGFGVGGWEILDRAERAESFNAAIAPFQRLVGTASTRQRPLAPERLVTPRELPSRLAEDPQETETALIFGPEDNGLTGRELDACHPVVTIPCALEHPTLNLAQAVLIVAYELRLADLPKDESPPAGWIDDPRRQRATAAEVQALLTQSDRALEQIGYDQDLIRTRLVDDLRRLLARAGPSAREARLLRRLLNRASKARAPHLDRASDSYR